MQQAKTLHVTTPTDLEVVVTRVFDAPARMLFDAHTKPELVKRWLTGFSGWRMEVCEIDLRVGGKYRYVLIHTGSGETAYQDFTANGTRMGWGGEFREIVRPTRLVNTELFDEDWTGGETLVTLVFTERDGKTTLTMTVLYSSKEARDGAIATGMTDGMAVNYGLLDDLLASMQTGKGS